MKKSTQEITILIIIFGILFAAVLQILFPPPIATAQGKVLPPQTSLTEADRLAGYVLGSDHVFYRVVTIDYCEYISGTHLTRPNALVHKGNCSNFEHKGTERRRARK